MLKDLSATDLHGLSRLAVHGVAETTSLVEQVHRSIARVSPPVGRLRPGSTRGITGLVYRSIRGATGLVGGALDLGFKPFSRGAGPVDSSPQRDAFLAILNGVIGDHLEATDNPLSIPMRLRPAGTPPIFNADVPSEPVARVSPRLLVAIHGLCQSDRCWSPKDESTGIDLPLELSRAHGYSSLYLGYNTGRRITANGRDLAVLLDRLDGDWPVPINDITLLGHSMGGLVARSACHYGLLHGHAWIRRVGRVITLGTPHHGSPLEKAGYGVERLLDISPYSAPFARLGRMRSAGITDLREGRVFAAAAGEPDRPAQAGLPEQAALYAIAATTAERLDGYRARLLGDGLVPINSALGRHSDPARCLSIPAARQRILTSTGHMELLHHRLVLDTLNDWLSA